MHYVDKIEKKLAREEFKKVLSRSSEFIENGILKDAIKKYLSPETKILELGCSVGDTARFLKKIGYKNLILSDFDFYLENEEFKDSFLQVDLNSETISLEDSACGGIIALNVLEHLENPFHFARECARILIPGGYLFFSIPNGHNIFDKIKFLFSGDIWAYHKKNDHITFLLKDTFNKVFKDFDLVDSKNGTSWIPYLWPTRLNKKVRPYLRDICPKWDILNYNKFYVMKLK